MLLEEAGCFFVGFILYISEVDGEGRSICALKGSTVELPLSGSYHTSKNNWYTEDKEGDRVILRMISVDGFRIMSTISEEGQFALTINDLRETDESIYCYTDNSNVCGPNGIQLSVSDLQVKVIPTTENQTVTLMCSTSCALTETPAAYIWYKNREFLYEDWSPWYQELVSSEEGVTYSCAIKGYEDLRAPDVSVDSVSSTCFTVTYAKGRMCSYQQKSEDESCSITYPREVHVGTMPAPRDHVRLTCSSSCPLMEPPADFTWYKNRCAYFDSEVLLYSIPSNDSFSCAVKGFEHLHSENICTKGKICRSVNYVNRRICVLEGSSVNISSDHTHPKSQNPESKFWYKKKRRGEDGEEKLTGDDARMESQYHTRHSILAITKLTERDSGEYALRFQEDNKCKRPHLPGVTLFVTGLRVTQHPAVVTDGHRVTLTCSTSCPLSANMNYIWHFNDQPLTLPESQNKHLVLDPVSSEHVGTYSCSVGTGKQILSSKTTTLRFLGAPSSPTTAAVAASGAGAALLVIIALTVCWCVRKKRTSGQPARPETSQNTLNTDAMYENIPHRPTQQDDHHYVRLSFSRNRMEELYATIMPGFSK